MPKPVKYEDYSAPYVSETDKLGAKRRDPYSTAKLPSQLQYYKADARTGKRETLPMTIREDQPVFLPYGAPALSGARFPVNSLNPIAKIANNLYAIQQSQQYGGPKVTPEDMTALLFQEGSYDFGLNSADMYGHDKQASELRAKLGKGEGYLGGINPADLAASILYAKKKGAELGVPWTKVWNGLGRNVTFGRSTDSAMFGGKVKRGLREVDYVKEQNQNREIVNDPKNAEILNFIRQQMAPPPSLDTLNQQEYQRRLAARNAYVNDRTAERVKGGTEAVGIDDRIAHGVGALLHGQNPFASWSPKELDAYYRKGVEKGIPAVRPYMREGKNLKLAKVLLSMKNTTNP